MKPKRIALSPSFIELLQRHLQEISNTDSPDAHTPQAYAQSIKKLSDFYIENPRASTPWEKDFAKIATLAYFLPLNFARLASAAQEPLQRGFFDGLSHWVDFGCGPATASLALMELLDPPQQLTLIDRAPLALKLGEKLLRAQQVPSKLSFHPPQGDKFLFIASYSLTETQLPSWAWKAQAMVLIEPSTQEDARRLMALRSELIAQGFHLWSPCTHHQECPLLKNSKRDWCHDRAHFQSEWFTEIEKHLPFKNNTLTWTALFANKSAPPSWPDRTFRVTGDLLEEKGRSRQMICRSDQREFLLWLHRHHQQHGYARGELAQMSEGDRVIK